MCFPVCLNCCYIVLNVIIVFFFYSVDGLSGRDVVFKVWRDLWRLQRPADQSSALGGGGGGQPKRPERETDCRVAGASAVKVYFFDNFPSL